MSVEVYTTKTCPYCIAAKSLLKQKEIEFVEHDVTFNDSMRLKLMKKTKQRTVPQIFIDKEHIGGFDDLNKYFKDLQIH